MQVWQDRIREDAQESNAPTGRGKESSRTWSKWETSRNPFKIFEQLGELETAAAEIAEVKTVVLKHLSHDVEIGEYR